MPADPAPAPAAAAPAPARPLCLGLDGTLLRGDKVWGQGAMLLRADPLRFPLRLAWWTLRGKAHVKERLAILPLPPGESLAVDDATLAGLRAEHAAGRRIELVTGTHRAAAALAARRLGIPFDAVLSSDEKTNLTSRRKAALLVSRHGERGFDYAGNSSADLAVWAAAGRAVAVNVRPAVLARLRATHPDVKVHSTLPPTAPVILRQLRPHQWVKNLLVFLPLLLAHRLGDGAAWLASAGAFASFCLLASAAYALNDLLDVAADRAHPEKRLRPLPAGEIAPAAVAVLAVVLPLLGFVPGWFLPGRFALGMLAYFAGTVAYSLWAKRLAGADVIVLTGLYTLRILAGGWATGIFVSPFLLSFSVFFFLSLSLVKRHGELLLLAAPSSALNPQASTSAPLPSRGYLAADLDLVRSFGTSSAYVSVLVLVLYLQSEIVARLYPRPEWLWLLGPLLAFWFHRVWFASARGLIPGDPIPFVLRDRASWVVAGLAGGMLLAAARA